MAGAAAATLLIAGCGADDGNGDDQAIDATTPDDAPADEPADGGQDAGDPCPQDGNEREVNADCIDPWPLTVNSGTLRCEADAVTIAAQGNTWNVNGVATSRDIGDEIEPIWEENPEIEGTRVNIGPLIDAGLDLC